MTEQQLFVSQQYGVANMILSAALRCCKVTHYDTQQILFEIAQSISEQYDEIHLLSINDMYCFMPEADVFASLHEKGRIRMFMN
jgi:urease accessory protein